MDSISYQSWLFCSISIEKHSFLPVDKIITNLNWSGYFYHHIWVVHAKLLKETTKWMIKSSMRQTSFSKTNHAKWIMQNESGYITRTRVVQKNNYQNSSDTMICCQEFLQWTNSNFRKSLHVNIKHAEKQK